jgi:hypothetical protein
MALQPQKVQVSIAGGLDTKTDEKNVAAISFLELENLKFTKTGALSKRNGYAELVRTTSGAAITAGAAVTSFNDELLQFDGSKLYTYLTSDEKWQSRGFFTNCIATEKPAIGNGLSLSDVDFYSNGQLTAYIAVTKTSGFSSKNYYIKIVDNADNKVLSSFVFAAYSGATTTNKLAVAYLNGRFYFFYRNAANSAIAYRYISASNLTTISAESTLGSLSEIRVLSAFNSIYVSGLNGNNVIVYQIPPSFTIPGGVIIATNGTSAAAMNEENLKLRMLYTNTTNELVSSLYNQQVTAQLHSPAIISSAAFNFSATEYYDQGSAIYFNTLGTNSSYDLERIIITPSGGLFGGTTIAYSTIPASKAASLNKVPYILIQKAYKPYFDSSFLVQDTSYLETSKIIAQYGNRGAYKSINNTGHIPALQAVNGQIYGAGIILAGAQDLNTALLKVPTTATNFRADFSQTLNYFDAELSKNLHVSGGILKLYDGASVTEHGFLEIPPTSAAGISKPGTQDSQGGYLGSAPTVAGTADIGTYVQPSALTDYLPGGDYFVSYMYVYRDRNGQTHRSPPAVPWKVTLAGATTYQMTHYVRTPTISEKDIIEIEVYRTVANGSVLYRLSGFVPGGTDRIILGASDRSVAYKSLTDFVKDTDLTLPSQPALYTDSGELEANNAQPSKYITTLKNRIWLLSADGTRLYYSKLNVLGTPIEFNDNLYIDLDRRGGNATALGVLDEYLVVFKENAIFLLAGEGPNNLGEQNDYRQPQLVSSDGGCSEPNSIVIFPHGVMYKSAKGIYSIDRSLKTAYIGDKVERYNSEVVTSATLMPTLNEVRFTTEGQKALVYDYYHNLWTTFTNLDAIDAVSHAGTYHYLRADGRVRKETPGLFSDAGSFIRAYFRTAWIQFAGLQGYQRIWSMQLLGTFKSNHKLVARFGYDYDPASLHQADIDATVIAASTAYGAGNYGAGVYGGNYQDWQFEIRPKIQKCQAIQMTLEDTQDGTLGESFSISNMAVEIGVMNGLARTPAASKVGAT